MVQSIDLNFGIDRILSADFSSEKQKPETPDLKALAFLLSASLKNYEAAKTSRLSVKEITKSKKRASPTEKISPNSRKRVTFTSHQLNELEIVFRENQYVHGAERVRLAKKLGLEPMNVKNWFQNRRIRYRRKQNRMSSSESDN